jgi:hypothetical protein
MGELKLVHQKAGRYIEVGKAILRKGCLEDRKCRKFICNPRKITKCFANNYNGVFGERTQLKNDLHSLDDYIAGLFCLMAPGSILVTLHPLSMVPPRTTVNERRARHKQKPSSSASFYEMEELELGEGRHVASWSEHGGNKNKIKCYKYTRVHQPNETEAIFMCWNPYCRIYKDGTRLSASKTTYTVDSQERIVPNFCSCASGPNTRSMKKA